MGNLNKNIQVKHASHYVFLFIINKMKVKENVGKDLILQKV
jgi:hypothetical protein